MDGQSDRLDLFGMGNYFRHSYQVIKQLRINYILLKYLIFSSSTEETFIKIIGNVKWIRCFSDLSQSLTTAQQTIEKKWRAEGGGHRRTPEGYQN